MTPHPDFEHLDIPRVVSLGQYSLTPLSPEFLEEDYAAVMTSASVLQGLFGDWPAGLSREDNLIDLAWHEREFTTRRSFSWIIRDAENLYVGCFYLFPMIGGQGTVQAVMWLCGDIPNRCALASGLHTALSAWCAQALPQDLVLSWKTRPILTDVTKD